MNAPILRISGLSSQQLCSAWSPEMARSEALVAHALGYPLVPLDGRKQPLWAVLPQKVNERGELLWMGEHGKETTTNTGRQKRTWKLEESSHPQNWTQAEISAWFNNPVCKGFGVRTGEVSRIIAVDFDSEEAYGEALRKGLPDTEMHQSARGAHYIYRYDPRIASAKLAGCDIKADGGYIAWVGTLHPSGIIYTLKNDAPVSSAPVWMTESAHGAEKTPEAAARTARISGAITSAHIAQGSALDEVMHYLSYPLIAAEGNASLKNWIAVGGIIKDAGGSIGDFDWFSQQNPAKYAENGLGHHDIQQTWDSLKGKRRATASKLNAWDHECNGGQATRDWFKLHPELSRYAKPAPMQDVTQDDKSTIVDKGGPLRWPADVPMSIDRLWTKLKLAKSAIILLGAVLRAFMRGDLDADDMTVKVIEDATGLSRQQVRDGLEKGDGVFLVFSANGITHHYVDTETSNAENTKISDSAKKPGRPSPKVTINTPEVAIQNLLDRIVSPYGTMRLFPEHSTRRYAPPDPELLKAAGITSDDLTLLKDNLTYPDGNEAALKLREHLIANWRAELSDLTPQELPALPDDKPITNGKTLRAAKVLAAVLPHTSGGKISLDAISKAAGISKRLVSDLLPYAGIKMTENIVYKQVLTLPKPAYDPDCEGFAAECEIIDECGEIKRLPYALWDREKGDYVIPPDVRYLAQTALDEQRPVSVGYRQSGSPDIMTAEQREAALTDQAMRKRQASKRAAERRTSTESSATDMQIAAIVAAGKNKAKSPVEKHDIPGYSARYALAWRSALPDHLPADIAVHYLPTMADKRQPQTADDTSLCLENTQSESEASVYTQPEQIQEALNELIHTTPDPVESAPQVKTGRGYYEINGGFMPNIEGAMAVQAAYTEYLARCITYDEFQKRIAA